MANIKVSKRTETQRVLLEAAKSIVLSDGHEAVTVRRVADLTGYSYPIMYHYFKDLNALLWTLRLEMIGDMVMDLKKATPPPTGAHKAALISQIKEIFHLYAQYFFKHPTVFRFFYFHNFSKPEDDQEYTLLEASFSEGWFETFGGLVKLGVLSADAVEIVAKTIIYSLEGMIMLSLSKNGSLTENDVYEELNQLISYLLKMEG
ncbi:MAG: TetR/AcrR family transcriptional regulator [Firmicutes bacterium]|nr:TetR/AcrR family transcriptional regulator [Bacillota bacterium]